VGLQPDLFGGHVEIAGRPGSLVVADWFTPFRDVDHDGSHKDQDLAAGGVIAL
jgi:hypothetical protein